MKPSVPVGALAAVVDGPYSQREKLRLVRLLLEAALPAPRFEVLPLWQPGIRWIGVEWQSFRCERLKATLPVYYCLVRRSRVWPSGGGKGCPRHAECQGCPVGEENAARCPGIVLPPSTLPRESLTPTQRQAKRARALAGLGDDEVVRMDPLKVAAGMTPDDRNDWRG